MASLPVERFLRFPINTCPPIHYSFNISCLTCSDKGDNGEGQGCCKIILPACGGSQKEKKEVFAGTPRTPAEGCGPLHSRSSLLFPILQQPCGEGCAS